MVDAEEILGLPQFEGLDDAQLMLIAELLEERHIKAGEDVFAEGDKPDGMYILRHGALDVRIRVGEAGTEASVHVIKPVEIFGEIAFLDAAPRTATIGALQDSEVLYLSNGSYQEIAFKFPAIDHTIIRNMATTLARRLRAADTRLKELIGGWEEADPSEFKEVLGMT